MITKYHQPFCNPSLPEAVISLDKEKDTDWSELDYSFTLQAGLSLINPDLMGHAGLSTNSLHSLHFILYYIYL